MVCYEFYLSKIVHFLEEAILFQEYNNYATLPFWI